MTLGEKLRALREHAGESLREASAASDCTKPHLWELERGKSANPTLNMLRRLATHYGVPVAKLIDETPLDLS